jgi:TatD DNase family protein
MHIVDSHAHLDSERYADDLPAVLARSFEAGVRSILAIGIGDGPHEMHRALDIARQYSGQPNLPSIHASAGIHPQEAAATNAAALDKLASLTIDPQLVAVGEIGLDYYHLDNPLPKIQHDAFVQQMDIAAAAKLPILLHVRTADAATPEAQSKFADCDAWRDLLELLESHWRRTGLGGVMHCFSGNQEQVRRSLDLGFLISFAGNVTYPKAQPLRDAAALVPLDRLLVETDAPFLAPVPNRGQRNEPAWTRLTAERLAAERNIALEQLAATTTANFHALLPKTCPSA